MEFVIWVETRIAGRTVSMTTFLDGDFAFGGQIS
jgi:hypothetical protein